MKRSAVLLFSYVFLVCAAAATGGSGVQAQVKQTPEVIEAYRTLREYRQLLAEDLDFERAFRATFTRKTERLRAIAIADGEFGSEEDLKTISDNLLIEAYRRRMQIFYLMLALVGAGKIDAAVQMPPEIEKIARRASPRTAAEFPAFVSRLERDAAYLRTFVERTARENPAFAASLRKFRAEIRRENAGPPVDHQVKPTRGSHRGKVLKGDEDFYEINGYTLVREEGKMKIVGIRFFTRLF